MANKVTEALGRAVNNFQRADIRAAEQPTISKAEAAGLRAPPLSAEHRAGLSVDASLAKQRFDATAAAHSKYEKERADYEAARDDEIWKRVLARRVAL